MKLKMRDLQVPILTKLSQGETVHSDPSLSLSSSSASCLVWFGLPSLVPSYRQLRISNDFKSRGAAKDFYFPADEKRNTCHKVSEFRLVSNSKLIGVGLENFHFCWRQDHLSWKKPPQAGGRLQNELSGMVRYHYQRGEGGGSSGSWIPLLHLVRSQV